MRTHDNRLQAKNLKLEFMDLQFITINDILNVDVTDDDDDDDV